MHHSNTLARRARAVRSSRAVYVCVGQDMFDLGLTRQGRGALSSRSCLLSSSGTRYSVRNTDAMVIGSCACRRSIFCMQCSHDELVIGSFELLGAAAATFRQAIIAAQIMKVRIMFYPLQGV